MMNTKQLYPYVAPVTEVFKVTGNHPVLTSGINALAIDNAISGIDELEFSDFNQSF